jgi:hypothetical protein
LRDSGVASKPLMLSPRKDGISTPLTTSIGLDRGLDNMESDSYHSKVIANHTHLANCPAIRAIRTTGLLAPVTVSSRIR